MNGRRAREIRRAFAVKHVRLARLTREEIRTFPVQKPEKAKRGSA